MSTNGFAGGCFPPVSMTTRGYASSLVSRARMILIGRADNEQRSLEAGQRPGADAAAEHPAQGRTWVGDDCEQISAAALDFVDRFLRGLAMHDDGAAFHPCPAQLCDPAVEII